MKKTFLLTLVLALCFVSEQSADCKDVKQTYTVEKSIDVMQSQTGWRRTPPTRLATETFTFSSKKDADEAMKTAIKLGANAAQRGKTNRGDLLRRKRPDNTVNQVGANDSTDQPIKDKTDSSSQTVSPPRIRSGDKIIQIIPADRSDYHGGYQHSPAQGRPVPQQVRSPRKQPTAQTKQTTRTSSPQSNYAASYGTYDGKPKKRNF